MQTRVKQLFTMAAKRKTANQRRNIAGRLFYAGRKRELDRLYNDLLAELQARKGAVHKPAVR